MRIIDKNTDFYDYLQERDKDALVFDRTDSFILTKEELLGRLETEGKWDYKKGKWVTRPFSYNFLLLQVGNKFWLFLATVPANKDTYDLGLVAQWDNYDLDRALIKLDLIEFGWGIMWEISNKVGSRYNSDIELDRLHEKADLLVQAVNTKDYKLVRNLNYYNYYVGDFNKKIEKHIPILKACGIANFIDPLAFYLALDEYFSLEKQASERIDAEGTTNNDKIVNHGFDTKTSFRGKI